MNDRDRAPVHPEPPATPRPRPAAPAPYGVAATDAELLGATGIYVAPDGALYVTTMSGRRVLRID